MVPCYFLQAIRPPNRYSGGVGGLIFPDRVLQTIASSPQDAVPVGGSSVSSDNPDSSSVTMLSSPPTSPIRLPPSSADDDSDSGCSTTDDELCQVMLLYGFIDYMFLIPSTSSS